MTHGQPNGVENGKLVHAFRRNTILLAVGSLLAAVVSGCAIIDREVHLPSQSIVEREQLLIHSDFHIPERHRLINELAARRTEIADQLKLPLSDEPINVFVFRNADQYASYMAREFPEFPDRRALFVKNDTTLKVFAWWSDRVGTDLRHEVTHGFLHSVIPNLPLWLDEGIAEFYETPRGSHGVNSSHIRLLTESFRNGDWEPSLESLERLINPASMNQLQYAESWLWVHFLLEGEQGDPKILQDQLARLRMSAESEPVSKFVDRQIDNRNELLIQHLKHLATSQRVNRTGQ